jgi:hypothetical protein
MFGLDPSEPHRPLSLLEGAGCASVPEEQTGKRRTDKRITPGGGSQRGADWSLICSWTQ